MSSGPLPHGKKKNKIPSRVHCSGSLELKESSMYSGTGVYTSNDIQEGGLVFSIKTPSLAVISEKNELYKTTCDHCFSAVIKHTPNIEVRTKPFAEFSLKSCSACKIAHYCSKKCLKAGWNHHHKSECRVYAAINQGSKQDPTNKCTSELRMLNRLLALYSGNKNREEWNEFLSLATETKVMVEQTMSPDWSLFELAVKIIRPFTNVFYPMLLDLASKIFRHQRKIYLPVLHTPTENHPRAIWTTHFMGSYFDPFVSLIKHSCDGNTWVVFEGNELRCRATRRILAHTELTMSYLGAGMHTFDVRRKKLRQNWGIDCKCPVCQNPSPEPSGALKAHLSRYGTYSNEWDNTMCFSLEEVQGSIERMKKAGFGFNNRSMLELHRMALSAHKARNNTSDILKLILKIYYVIEPAQIPPILPAMHLNTYWIFHSFMHHKHNPPRGAVLDIPKPINDIFLEIYFYLRYKLVLETEKCFGQDSIVAVLERVRFMELDSAMQRRCMRNGIHPARIAYVPLAECSKARGEFLKSMKKLLKWADIEGVPDEYLLGIHDGMELKDCGK